MGQKCYGIFSEPDDFEVLWPDFDLAAYHEALAAFGSRDRRFGGRNA